MFIHQNDQLQYRSFRLSKKTFSFSNPWSEGIILPGMISGSLIRRTYIAWYDFRILDPKKVWYDFRILGPKKVYCLVWFQDPRSEESILPGIISGSWVRRKYIAWYDFRIMDLKKVYCLVWFQDPLSWDSILLCVISVPGTWYRVPGTRCLVVGWYQVPGTGYLGPGTRYLVHGSWDQVPGTRRLGPGGK